ncbi:MAG: CoA-binding protein [Actinomycetota bacterium]
MGTTDYERIFHPGRMAIVGVCAEGGFNFANGILLACRAMGFAGEILPVNPRGGSFAGHTILPSLEEIPGEIDFAVIAVPAAAVPAALEACRRKGAAGAEVVTAGFGETGTREGRALEQQVREVAARGIRVVGPNCFGIYCPRSGLTLLPGPDLSRESGPVAFLSQSGGMSIDLAHLGKWMGLRFSKVVSFGNGADLREAELLRYLTDDPETGVIALYVEGVADGAAFFAAIRDAARRKPVVVLKGGLSEAGGRAVVGHTASMGGSRVIWSSVLRQVNAVQVHDLAELAQACLAFSSLPARAFRGISCVGGGGALGVAAGDAAEAHGIAVPPLPDGLRRRIEALLPRPGSSAVNPIDVANPFVPPQTLGQVLRLAAEDDRVELQMLISLLYHYKSQARAMGVPVAGITPFPELADTVAGVVADTGKPVVLVLPDLKRGGDDLDVAEMMAQAREAIVAKGIPVFGHIGKALRAVGHVNTYYGRRHGR